MTLTGQEKHTRAFHKQYEMNEILKWIFYTCKSNSRIMMINGRRGR